MTDDLKARLQAGETGPEVDLMFHRWLTGEDWEEGDLAAWWYRGEGTPWIHYTTSIDAAMGAVPEGLLCDISHRHVGEVTATLYRPGTSPDNNPHLQLVSRTGAPTLPCAILLAVIDARENQ
jgi:hypothetical protein